MKINIIDYEIGLDVDGVLANFWKAYTTKVDKPIETDTWEPAWFNEYIEMWEETKKNYDFWANLPILTDPSEIQFKVNCYISSMPAIVYEARVEWLKKNGFPDAPLFVTSSHDKVDLAKSRGLTHFVDDKPETVKAMNENGIKCFKFVPYYMKDEPTKYDIFNLNQIKVNIL